MLTSTDPQITQISRNSPLAIDGLIALILAAVSALLSALCFGYLDPVLYGLLGIDFWFQSDMSRAFYNMTEAESYNYRASVHPLFKLIAYHGVLFVKCALGLFHEITSNQAAQLVMVAVAGIWMATLYTLLRLLSLPRFDAVLFSLLGAFSAASLFWFSVPETYSFGSVSILSALTVAAVHQRRALAEGWFVLASTATMSITITNWMAGLAAAFINLRIGRALRVTLITFAVVYLFWLLEKHLFPTTGSFLHNSKELNYLFREETGGPVHILITFFSSTIVMPEIELIGKIDRPEWLMLSVQHSLPWDSGPLGLVASCGWLALFCLGLWHLLFGPVAWRFRLMIGAVLAGQLALHLIYGEETFLYSLHFLPLLIVTGALATTGRYRWLALVLVTVVLITAGTNNILRFREARQEMIQHFYPDRGTGSAILIQGGDPRQPDEFPPAVAVLPKESPGAINIMQNGTLIGRFGSRGNHSSSRTTWTLGEEEQIIDQRLMGGH